jgi:CRP/FNR family transcriptional regulator
VAVNGCGGTPGCEECDIRVLAVCRSVDISKLSRLAAIASCRRVEAGRTLFEEGDPAEQVYTLTKGTLKLYKLMADGRRQVVGFLVPGDFLGLAFGRTYVYTAEAITPLAACCFQRSRFMRLLEEFPALEREILGRTSNELAAAQRQMLLLGRKTARERLASFLADLAERSNATGSPLALPLGRADIADYLGLTIETVSRTFTSLRREGIINLPSAHQLVVREPGKLAQIAAC